MYAARAITSWGSEMSEESSARILGSPSELPTAPIESNQPTATIIKRYCCRHIHADGRRCGSPAMRGEPFCYQHHTMRRPSCHLDIPADGATFALPLIEDRAGIQHALSEVLTRIAARAIDPRHAALLLYGLRIASANLPRESRATSAACRNSRDSSSSRSSSNDHDSEDLIEEVEIDEALGELAPVAEVQPEAPRRNLLAEFFDEIDDPHTPEPDHKLNANPQSATETPHPATLPILQAVAMPGFTNNSARFLRELQRRIIMIDVGDGCDYNHTTSRIRVGFWDGLLVVCFFITPWSFSAS